jgi:Barstar (barnase inhibitor)
MKNADLPFVQVAIDCRKITDWDSYHDAFAAAFGFPDFYGRNMNAWVDCLTSLDVPADAMSSVHAPPGGSVVLRLDHAKTFATAFRDGYLATLECAAFVNWRRIEAGEGPILFLSIYE